MAADALVRCQVTAVINVAPSISGRYPNQGPQVLVDAGIPLVDDVGPDVFDLVKEGQQVRLDGETLVSGRDRGRQGHAADGRVGGART